MSTSYSTQKLENTAYSVRVPEESHGVRLDKFLSEKLDDLSRSRIKSLIESGQLTLIGGPDPITDSATKVKQGQELQLLVPPPEDATPLPEDIPLDVVFEDSELIVINKPAGMVVHPAPGNYSGTLVNALLHHCGASLSGIGGVARPGIVHRIDKDTSGLLVVAKSDAAHAGLSKLFEAHDIEREYRALVKGRPQPPAGRIEGNIARHSGDRKKMAVADGRGKHAVTHYKTLESYKLGDVVFASLVSCKLETGRTHQVRVHMSHIGNALMGDPAYGRKTSLPKSAPTALVEFLNGFNRQALHAAKLGFRHPVTGEDLSFTAPLPADMASLQKMLKSP